MFFEKRNQRDFRDRDRREGMIDKRTSIREVLAKFPQAARVFEEFGLGCAGCEAALFETIEQGAQVHGVDVDSLVEGLRKTMKEGWNGDN
jgi:hybrid cluster-associated redox disulfide protein